MRNLLLLVIIIYVSSCSSRNSSFPKYEVSQAETDDEETNFLLIDTLSIPLDSETGNDQYYGLVRKLSGKEYYVFFNHYTHALQGYNLNDPSDKWKIAFHKEGPNGIANPERFYIHQFDSIFFINTEYRLVSIADSAGLVKSRIELQTKEEIPFVENFYDFRYFPDQNAVSFWVYPPLNSYDGYDYWLQSKAVYYNIATDSITYFGGFPKDHFQDGIFETFEFINAIHTPKRTIIYTHASDELTVFSVKNASLLNRKLVKSNFQKRRTKPLIVLGEDRPPLQEDYNYSLTEPYCALMIANEDGSRIYRIEKLEVPLKNGDGSTRHFYDKPFSIITLDEDLKILNETKFPGKKYDYFHVFASGDKLYLSTDNPLNDKNEEDIMRFEIYQLENL